MSRIGKKPIKIPDSVNVKIAGQEITIEGPRGILKKNIPDELTLQIRNGEIIISPKSDKNKKKSSPIWGLTRSLIKNMILGSTEGFHKDLELVGVGYRAQADDDKRLVLNVGFSHPIEIRAPSGISFSVTEKTKVRVSGIDKALVGDIAAKIRAARPPEPYQGKGIRYVGEIIRRKVGKAAKVGAGLGG